MAEMRVEAEVNIPLF